MAIKDCVPAEFGTLVKHESGADDSPGCQGYYVEIWYELLHLIELY